MSRRRSELAMQRARAVLPGGVNSPVRSFNGVGGIPPFFASAQGQYLVDLDNNRYLDFVLAYGPLILGHLHPAVVSAITSQLGRGEAFGGPTEAEVVLGEQICQSLPGMEMVRLVNSGTEATMSAVRLARAATGRDLLIKFAGCYHGHSDALLAAAGSGVATLSLPGSPGVPEGTVADTVVLPFNDQDAVAAAFARHPGQIAAVIVEPIPGNMGVVLPEPGFLPFLREITGRDQSLLILDEVMTGFRVARSGAQGIYQVQPDLTCLGKVIGGGMPVGAFGGSRELMQRLAPEGDVYQAGTLSGNPLAVAAGLATLGELCGDAPYQRLEELGAKLERGVLQAARAAGVPVQVNRVGSMLTVFLTDQKVRDYQSAASTDRAAFATVHRCLLDSGIFWPPSPFEAAFLSLAHQDQDLERTVAAFAVGFQAVA